MRRASRHRARYARRRGRGTAKGSGGAEEEEDEEDEGDEEEAEEEEEDDDDEEDEDDGGRKYRLGDTVSVVTTAGVWVSAPSLALSFWLQAPGNTDSQRLSCPAVPHGGRSGHGRGRRGRGG